MKIMITKKKTVLSIVDFSFNFLMCTRCNYIFCLLQYDETEKRREMAKNSLERYMHYYERWASNQSVCFLIHDVVIECTICSRQYLCVHPQSKLLIQKFSGIYRIDYLKSPIDVLLFFLLLHSRGRRRLQICTLWKQKRQTFWLSSNRISID